MVQMNINTLVRRTLVAFALIISATRDVLLFCHGLGNIQYRPATSNDVTMARKILFQQAMNPLSIHAEHMIVASDDNDKVIGFGQIRPLEYTNTNDDMTVSRYSELASLFVDPDYRRMGIATSIIQKLLERQDDDNRNDNSHSAAVCLLTLRPIVPLYERHKFEIIMDESEIQKLPKAIQLERMAGSMISKFLGNDLVCMIRRCSE